MAKKKKSMFISGKEKTVGITARIPETLNNRINNVRESLESINPDLTFCTTTIVLEALEDSVNNAEKELAIMKKQDTKITSPPTKVKSEPEPQAT